MKKERRKKWLAGKGILLLFLLSGMVFPAISQEDNGTFAPYSAINSNRIQQNEVSLKLSDLSYTPLGFESPKHPGILRAAPGGDYGDGSSLGNVSIQEDPKACLALLANILIYLVWRIVSRNRNFQLKKAHNNG